MPGQLAAKIRAKFPGAYDDLDDAALERSVLAKHPEYTDLVEPVKPTDAPQERSVGGFMRNILPSAGRLIKETATGVPALGRGFLRAARAATGDVSAIPEVLADAKQIPAAAQAVGRHYKERYGGLENIARTAYDDPVGMAADVAPFTKGMLGAKVAAQGALRVPQAAGRALYRAGLTPSRRIQREFPGALDTGLRERILPTSGGLAKAERLGKASAAEADRLVAQADAAGALPVQPGQITRRFGPAREKAALRTKSGAPTAARDVQEVTERGQAVMRAGPQSLTEAQRIKRQTQRDADRAFRAEERGAVIPDLTADLDKSVAQGFREAIERNARGVGVDLAPVNQRTQSLLGVQQATEDAAQAPSRLSNLLATGGGALAFGLGGGPVGGLGAFLVPKLATSRRALAGAGIGLNELGRLPFDETLRAALLARLREGAHGEPPE